MPAFRQSRAHPVWSIAEVVREVMEQNAENEGTLATCARVSHTFSEPALEVLWRELFGLDRLLSILRKSVKHTEMTLEDFPNFPFKRFVFSAPIDDHEWSRFKHYANLVRSYATGHEILEGVFSATLLDKTRGEPLLPRLTTLQWTMQDESSSSFLLFFSPMLRIFHIDFFNRAGVSSIGTDPLPEDYATAAALRLIQARAPVIKQLHIQACHPCALEPVPSFVHLRSLTVIGTKDPRIFEMIANALPDLQDLSVYMVTQMRDEDILRAKRLPVARFRKLIDLCFGADPRMVPIVLNTIHAPSLEQLRLKMQLKDDICVRVCEIVAARFAQSIVAFVLELNDDDDNMHSRDFHALFSPLYAMRDLEEVSLMTHCYTDIVVTAEDISRIAEAWPNLSLLTLPCTLDEDDDDEEENTPLRMPVTALETLARRFPKLEEIIMPLPDPAPLADLDLATVPQGSNRLSLIRLLSGMWPQDVREKGRRYVERLFPTAEFIFDEDFNAGLGGN